MVLKEKIAPLPDTLIFLIDGRVCTMVDTNGCGMPRVTNTLDEVRRDFEVAQEVPSTLYTASVINRNGAVINESGDKEPIGNAVARWLLCQHECDGALPIPGAVMPDRMSYYVERHGIVPRQKATAHGFREEEHIAIGLYKKKWFDTSSIDAYIHYQTPICRDGAVENVGKIDLLAVCDATQTVYLMELKRPNSSETLLRCVCEAYTYYRQTDEKRLLCEFSDKINPCTGFATGDLSGYGLRPAVLVFENSRQHQQFESPHFSNVRALMATWQVDMFIIERPDEHDVDRWKIGKRRV